MRPARSYNRRLNAIASAVVVVVAFAVGMAFGSSAVAVPAPTDAAGAEAKIDAMSASLSTTLKSHSVAANDLASTRAAIAANKVKGKKLDSSIADGRARLAAQARFLYLTGNVGFAEILFGSTTLEDFVNRSLALRRVTARDNALVKQLSTELAQRNKLKRELIDRERAQAALVARLAKDRAAAQRALNAQQRYADSLSADVAAQLDSQRSARNSGPTPVTTKPTAKTGSVVSAKVEGRSGSYAVLAGQPLRYEPTGVKFTGIATWYGNVRPNMRTASGRPFNENELTCAHKSLPFGTRVAVTFRGKSVIVTVTDRGPYGKGRVIDVTKRAASIIGLKSAGVGDVKCEVVRPQ